MKITIDGRVVDVEENKSIFNICKDLGIKIPTLCYHKSLFPEARCRICLVELDGKLVTSCSTKPHEGAVIVTGSDKIHKARHRNMELMRPNMPTCGPDDDYEICKIYKEVGIENTRFESIKDYHPDLGASVIRDNNKCINCGRCVQVCSIVQDVCAIDFSSRAHNEHVTPYFEKPLSSVACIKCGQCKDVCPFDAVEIA